MKNHRQNVVGRLVPDPFLKNQSLAYRWINSVKYLQFVFIVCLSRWLSMYISKLSCLPLALTLNDSFSENKGRPVTSLPATWTNISALLLKNTISHVIFCYLTKFHCWIVFTSWIVGEYVYYYCLFFRLKNHNIWNQRWIFYQAVLPLD